MTMTMRRLADVDHHARGREGDDEATGTCQKLSADGDHHARGRELTGGVTTSPEAQSMYDV